MSTLALIDRNGLAFEIEDADSDAYNWLHNELGVVWDSPWNDNARCIEGDVKDALEAARQADEEGWIVSAVINEDGEIVDADGLTDKERERQMYEARKEERALHEWLMWNIF